MKLQLDEESVALLKSLVHERIKWLGPEIHHTNSREYRAELQKLLERLESLERTLGDPVAA